MNSDNKPRRLAEAAEMSEKLSSELPAMRRVVSHNRRASKDVVTLDARRSLEGCVLIEMWREADGSESIVIKGESEMGDLQIKGLLLDGVYSISHKEDADYAC